MELSAVGERGEVFGEQEEFCWEEGEKRRVLNSRLSLLQLGRPAALMKTSEQTDCPTLLETRGRERAREKNKEVGG